MFANYYNILLLIMIPACSAEDVERVRSGFHLKSSGTLSQYEKPESNQRAKFTVAEIQSSVRTTFVKRETLCRFQFDLFWRGSRPSMYM